jgi:hypothetical protein
LSLTIKDGKISGSDSDAIGAYDVTGTYAELKLNLEQAYKGAHTLTYDGDFADDKKNKITGTYKSSASEGDSGKFELSLKA